MEIYEIVKNNARLGYYSIIKDHRGRPRTLDPTGKLLREASNFAKYGVINGG